MLRFQSFRTSSSLVEEKKFEDPIISVKTAESASDNILDIVQNEPWYKQPLTFVVVGASGDLAKKKTYPALFDLWTEGLLPKETEIWGFARTPHTNDQLRDHIQPYLEGHQKKAKAEDLHRFLQKCFYQNGTSYGDWQTLADILRGISQLHNLVVYLAVPPHVFGESTFALKQAINDVFPGIPGFVRIVLEKPFGRDTATCLELLETLREQQWNESEMYRIDHYLGKEMVQNILPFRRYNSWLTPLWKKEVIKSVHIVLKETVGTEGRGGYFDSIGIIRDICQNHLMQVLTLLAMDMPEKWSSEEIRDAKVNVLKSMPLIIPEDCLLGQYIGYKDDSTIENADTKTPTYVCMRCWVNTPNWNGVPFILEAGKALDERLCEVRLFFQREGGSSDALVLRLQPTPGVFLSAYMKTPGYSSAPVSTHLGVEYGACQIPEAYSRLLLDVVRGEQSNFVRDDELLEAWRIFTPVLLRLESVNPKPYDKKSDGPNLREDFLSAMGVAQGSLPPASAL